MPPATLAPAAKPPSGRYLSFADREEIALGRAQGHGVREIARRLGRSASTISRELRRNAATRGGGLEYRATTAQWHAERAARRPKPAKLAVDAVLRSYGPWTGRALEGPAARAAAESAMGQGVEPGADRSSPAPRLPR
jgi:transposase-like protein